MCGDVISLSSSLSDRVNIMYVCCLLMFVVTLFFFKTNSWSSSLETCLLLDFTSNLWFSRCLIAIVGSIIMMMIRQKNLRERDEWMSLFYVQKIVKKIVKKLGMRKENDSLFSSEVMVRVDLDWGHGNTHQTKLHRWLGISPLLLMITFFYLHFSISSPWFLRRLFCCWFSSTRPHTHNPMAHDINQVLIRIDTLTQTTDDQHKSGGGGRREN